MKKFLDAVKEKARDEPKKIAFPEIFDDRTLPAVMKVAEEGTAIPILPGNPKKILEDIGEEAKKFIGEKKIFLWDMGDAAVMEKYAKMLFELRKHKGVTEEQARKLLEDVNYYGVMMLQAGDVDGVISGAASPTADTLRPALQIIKTKGMFHKVSGFFFMVLPEDSRLLMFADCAVNIEPSSHELAEIAVDTAETAKRFGIEPKIAMLSFSTAGSAKHPSVDIVREATAMVRHKRPDLLVDGEMQVDAALVPSVSKRKYPDALVKGDANILIFPNLAAANIAYKLVERLAHAQAIGPILQGLKKPVNDLSRGCSVDDIVNLAAITTVEARELSFPIQKILS